MDTEKNTKQKILEEALNLFSQKGYEGVSIREIAAEVGIKGASIYNHFKGKEEIFYGIFEEMKRRYEDMAKELSISNENNAEAAERFIGLEEQEMCYLAKEFFSFFVNDEFMVKFRRMLVSEQNRNEMAAKTLKEYYLDAPVMYQAGLFRLMQEQGAFLGYDAETMALHFYSPVYYLLNRYDLEGDYDACVEKLEKHLHGFITLYK